MKHSVCVLVAAALLFASCTTATKLTTTLTNPVLTQSEVDRTVSVADDFEWSVKGAGSVEWLTLDQTQLGVDIFETVKQAAQAATTSPIAAAQAALTTAANWDRVKGSRLEIYLRAAVTALDLVKQIIGAGGPV
jgi:hypothetical protein